MSFHEMVDMPRKGEHYSKEARQKMSESRMGDKNPMSGKRHSKEARQKMSESRIGDKNPMWKGDKASQTSGRERARRALQRAGINTKGFDVHHIDGNPVNNELSNLQLTKRRKHMVVDGRMEKLIKRNREGIR